MFFDDNAAAEVLEPPVSFLHALVQCRAKYRSTPLHLCGSPLATRMLCTYCHADTELRSLTGATPLLHFIARNNIPVAKELIRQGAQIDIHDQFGCSGLLAAVLTQNTELVTLLLESGVDVNRKDKNGATAMCSLVVRPRDLPFVALLLRWGADTAVVSGNRPLMAMIEECRSGEWARSDESMLMNDDI